jgi:predicted MFS family arabinose efflux permease
VTFSPVETYAATVFHVNVIDVGYIAVMYPIVYILLALPSGKALDAFFRKALLVGIAFNAVAGIGRLLDPLSFGFIFGTQILGAIAQPFLLSSIPLFARKYFMDKQRVTAVSISSIGIYAGIVVAMAIGFPLFQVGGIIYLETIIAIITLIATIWSLAVLFTAEEAAPSSDQLQIGLQTSGLKDVLKGKQLWILGGILAVGLGVFDSLSSWLQPIFSQFGLGDITGSLLGIVIIAGIIGSAIIPQIASRYNRRALILMTASLFTAATFFAIAVWQNLIWISIWLIIDGFLLLSAWPIVFEWIEKFVQPRYQGQSTGLIMLVGHIFAIAVVVAMGEIIFIPNYALAFLAVVALIGFVLTFGLPRKA